jgi:small subunit ribosomal protein S20
MANHFSAKKRAIKSKKINARNRAYIASMKTAITKVKKAIQNKDIANIDTLFASAQSLIAKTRQKGRIHTNTMARKISKLCVAVKTAKGDVVSK